MKNIGRMGDNIAQWLAHLLPDPVFDYLHSQKKFRGKKLSMLLRLINALLRREWTVA